MKIKDITRALRFDIMRALLFAALLLAMPAIAGAAGHIAPTGVTETEASQLIFWYDESQSGPVTGLSFVMITNGSTDTGVNIHVQIFADEAVTETPELCREHDFTDTLTPSDTVIYELGDLNLADDPGCDVALEPCGNNAGAAIAIDLDGTRGFLVVTAVDTVTLPRQAIAFNHLFGTIDISGSNVGLATPEVLVRTNGMGRRAINFADGSDAAQGTVLDGVTTGLRLLQPSLLSFNFLTIQPGNPFNFSSINSITFTDVYVDPSGEYRASPSTVVWDPLIFDEFEVGTSCQQHTNTCFVIHGVNDESSAYHQPFNDDFLLCPASDNEAGWVNMAVSGLSGLANNVGVTAFVAFGGGDTVSAAGASWMMAQ